MAKRKSRFVTQAEAQSLLRYGGSQNALVQAAQAAQDAYKTSVEQARSTSDLITSAVDQARPEVTRAYDDAATTAGKYQQAGQDALGLQNTASAVSAAAALEREGLGGRLAESRANALTSLSDRRVGAQAGRAYAELAARRTLASDTGKVLQQQQQLASEKGLYTSVTAQQLRDAAQEEADKVASQQASLDQQERSSIRSSGTDPDTGLPTQNAVNAGKSGSGKSGSGKSWVPSGQQNSARSTIQQAVSAAQLLVKQGVVRSDVATALKNGVKGQPVYTTDAAGKRVRALNADGTPKVTSSLPQVKDQLLLSVALDMAFDGHVSRRNADLLHKNGIKVDPLGVTTFQQWRKRQRTTSRPANAPAQGGSRPT